MLVSMPGDWFSLSSPADAQSESCPLPTAVDAAAALGCSQGGVLLPKPSLRSVCRRSWGILHPHPFKREKDVREKPAGKPMETGLNVDARHGGVVAMLQPRRVGGDGNSEAGGRAQVDRQQLLPMSVRGADATNGNHRTLLTLCEA